MPVCVSTCPRDCVCACSAVATPQGGGPTCPRWGGTFRCHPGKARSSQQVHRASILRVSVPETAPCFFCFSVSQFTCPPWHACPPPTKCVSSQDLSVHIAVCVCHLAALVDLPGCPTTAPILSLLPWGVCGACVHPCVCLRVCVCVCARTLCCWVLASPLQGLAYYVHVCLPAEASCVLAAGPCRGPWLVSSLRVFSESVSVVISKLFCCSLS